MLMKTQFVPKEKVERKWLIVDATDKVLGRLASRVAVVLQGKHKPIYAPHVDTGDFVIVVNASKVKVTGRKLEKKEYVWWSGYPGGQKRATLGQLLAKKPEFVFSEAVRLMLPKTTLGRMMLRKLKVYAGPDHPHQAQRPAELKL